MTYCTLADLIERFGVRELVDLTDRANPPAGAVDQAVVDAAIADAGELIDGYVGTRHELPLASVPGILRGIACDLVRLRLHKDAAPEEVRQAADAAVSRLKDIALGRLTLQVAGTAPASAGGRPKVAGAAAVFSRGTLGDFLS